MSHITFVRHGQANTHATTAADYDRLSPVGHQQAVWLGEYLRAHEHHYDYVWSGDMSRQRATAAGIGHHTPKIDPRLNEFDYFTLASDAEAEHGLIAPQTPEEFTRHIPQLLDLWRADKISKASESFAQFEDRTAGVVDDILSQGGRALVVSSGGVISMVLRQVLGLEIPAMTHVMFQVRNSSVTELEQVHGLRMLAGFNAIPHLAAPDRAFARTFI